MLTRPFPNEVIVITVCKSALVTENEWKLCVFPKEITFEIQSELQSRPKYAQQSDRDTFWVCRI
jgi:hypothetical protein